MNFFITNREIIKKGNKEFIREDGREHAGDNLRFGTYELETKKFDLFPEPKKDVDLIFSKTREKRNSNLAGSVRFFNELYEQLIQDEDTDNDVLFFIHGFNTDLNGVRDNFKTLNEKYVDNENSPIKHIVIFTWPGRSPLIPYHYFDDKKDAIRSGEALARGIEKLKEFFKKFLYQDKNQPCNRKINMMIHSMAHRVLKHMMIELKRRDVFIPELFTEILLMAADIEYDIFESQNAFESLIDFGDRIHIYYHKRDRVLDISKYTKNFSNRLGRIGRRKIEHGVLNTVDVDVSDTNDDEGYGFREDALNHWYYYSSNEVVDDVISVLNGGKSNL